MTILAILLCVFNLVMWLLFIVRFKDRFSTDDIVQNTRDVLDKMLMDINRNAERNVTLVENKINELKAVSQEVDRHLEVLRGELANVEKTNAFQNRLLAATKKTALESGEKQASGAKSSAKKTRSAAGKTVSKNSEKKTAMALELPGMSESGTAETSVKRPRGPLASYQYEKESMARIASEMAELKEEKRFSQEIDDIVRKSSFEIEEKSDGQKVDDIPEVVVSENQIKSKKSKKDQVRELSEQGLDIEEIADKLNISTTETEFILDMLN